MIFFPGCNHARGRFICLEGIASEGGHGGTAPCPCTESRTFWELGSLSHQLILENSPSSLYVPFLESPTPQEVLSPQSACTQPAACFCSLPPRVPRKSHDPVLGVDFTFSLVFSEWWDLSCHSFTKKMHPILHSEIKLDRDRRAHSEFPGCFCCGPAVALPSCSLWSLIADTHWFSVSSNN